MQSALEPLIRAVVFYVLSLLMVTTVLVLGGLAYHGVRDFLAGRDDVETLVRVQDEVGQYRRRQAAILTDRLRGAQGLPVATVERRIQALTGQLRASVQPDTPGLQALLRAGPELYAEGLVAHYRAELGRELAAQELAYLQRVRAHLMLLHGRADAQRELRRLHGVHLVAYGRYLQKMREQDALGPVQRQLMRSEWTQTPALRQLARDVAARATDSTRAGAAYKVQKAALGRTGAPHALRPYAPDDAMLDRIVQPLDARVDEVRGAVMEHPLSRAAALLLPALPIAGGLLLAALAGRFAVRIFLYFALAPLATRRSPVRLGGGIAPDPASASASVSASAVAQAIGLAAHEELLVLPRYLQGAPARAEMTTRWLVQGRRWTSLVSGMVLLTCVRTRSREDQVVLSAGDGSLGELALIRVPAGAAMVFQPRALVGLVCDRAAPARVERHWRLTSLHAWLTLQLRYFLVRGPVTLVVQGRRGVRVGQADGGRLVRQAATLAFSADVAYSTQRSAPFLSYLRGQADLLYDRFSGDRGIYVHEETPEAGRNGGRIKRGLEGLTDGILKVFGV